MEWKNFLTEKIKYEPKKVGAGSFKPACGNTHYENKGSLTLYGVIESARKEMAEKLGRVEA